MAELLLFSAITPTVGFQLWASDGTAAGTQRLTDTMPGTLNGNPYALAADGDRVVFMALDPESPADFALWETDGTAAGTTRLAPVSADVTSLGVAGGTIFLVGDDGSHGSELWRAGADEASVDLLRDIRPGPDGSSPGPLIDLGGILYFGADDGTGRGLWRSDGTPSGTWLVADVEIDPDTIPGTMVEMDGTLYFAADDGTRGLELWRSDGTSSGTVLAAEIRPGASGSAPTDLAVADGTLYFAANDGTLGRELWKFDGTVATLVADLRPGPDSSDPVPLAAIGPTLLLSVDDGQFGRELWRSDGTASGTYLLHDIRPGDFGSDPGPAAAMGGRVYFGARDGSHGVELWVTDGSYDGTSLVVDINPLVPGDSAPNYLTRLVVPDPVEDTVPPETGIVTGPPPLGEATTAVFDLWASEEGGSFEGALDGGPWAAVPDPLTLTGLAAGPHSLAVRAVDAAGNADPTPAPYEWTVTVAPPDATPPETTILSGPESMGAPSTAVFDFAADEGGVTYEVSLDGGPWLGVPDPLTIAGLADGPHSLSVRATDAAGNVDPTPVGWGWVVGSADVPEPVVPPDTTIVAGPSAPGPARIAVVDLAGSESAVGFERRLDDGPWLPASDPLVLTGLAAGTHTLAARAFDLAGNVDATPATWSWVVQSTVSAPDSGPAPSPGGLSREIHSFAEADTIPSDSLVRHIQSWASLRLPDHVPNVTLLGFDELNADGNGAANVLLGNGSANVLVAYGGNDSVVGMGGDDFLAVGAGDDTVLGDDAAASVAGDDTVWGGQGADRIDGGAGDDLLNGDRGDDRIAGGAGDDLLNGGADADSLDGGDGADTLQGGQGGDLVVGGAGTDRIAGDAGADTLWGGIVGGQGDGASDLFVVQVDGEIEVIGDFEPGIDRLRVDASATGIIDMAGFHLRATDTDEGLLLALGAGSWLLLQGVKESEISLPDLLIV